MEDAVCSLVFVSQIDLGSMGQEKVISFVITVVINLEEV